MFTIEQEELQSILGQLDQAIYNHTAWFESITRTLICRLPYDKRDVREDAHKDCQFGQWYYNNENEILNRHPGFIAIGQEHAYMHQLAAQLLQDGSNGLSISTIAYDGFENSVERLRLQITSLQRELQDSLFNQDPLTGARNRVGMLTRLREQHELVKRSAQLCCVAMVDLDNFKVINDEYGHRTGDLVLKSVSHYMLEHIRPYDVLFRYGGEEFLLCMQQINLQAGVDLVERLRKGIGSLVFKTDNEPAPTITVSIGITLLDPDVFVEDSIQRADKALYQAKDKGRNCVQVWDINNSPH